jgi:hypothetical protein
MNIRERLMSRASVATMAAFAPKPEGAADASRVGQAENVDAIGGGGCRLGGRAGPLGGGAGAIRGDAGRIRAHRGTARGRRRWCGRRGRCCADGDGDGGEADGEVEAGAATDAPVDGAPAEGERREPRSISYGKHQRELAKAKKRADELEAKLNGAVEETAREREKRIRLDERTTQLLEAIQTRRAPEPDAAAAAAAAAAADPEPDADSDPIGHAQWKIRGLEKTVQELSSGRQQDQQQTAAQREEQNIYQVYQADLEREAVADPAFADAFAHLRETRYRELGFIYADIDITDPAQCARLSTEDQAQLSQNIQRAFYNEQMMVARSALQSKKSPAKVVANLARARGFTPKVAAAAAAPAAGAAPAAKNGNGVAVARAAAPAASVSDQLQAIREGTEASRSLSDAGGSPGGTITPERLATMSDDEFQALYNQMPKGQFDRLMGKPAQ